MLYLLKLCAKWALYCLSFLTPRKRKLWLFGSRNGQFVDNPKYLFLYALEHFDGAELVWLTKDDAVVEAMTALGLPVCQKWSMKGLWLSLRAGIYIYAFDSDDINFSCSGRAKKVNLYHGIPLKKIEFDSTLGNAGTVYQPDTLYRKIRSRVVYATKWQAIDLFQIPSAGMIEIHDGAFNHLIKSYHCGAHPRLLPVVEPELVPSVLTDEAKRVLELMQGYKEVWIYMPTWRVGDPDILSVALPDLDKLNSVLKGKNILLLLKMHLYSENVIEGCSHIKLIPAVLDAYPLLNSIDLLITDYSSISFDFQLTGRNIIFYSYDLDDYLSKSSDGFYFGFDDMSNDTKVSDFDSLLAIIEEERWQEYFMGDKVASVIWKHDTIVSPTQSNKKLINTIDGLWGVI